MVLDGSGDPFNPGQGDASGGATPTDAGAAARPPAGDLKQSPAPTQPGWPPATTEPGWPPATTEPGWPPAPTQPGWPPATTEPGWPPAPTQPGWPPATTQPGWPPAQTPGWPPTSNPQGWPPAQTPGYGYQTPPQAPGYGYQTPPQAPGYGYGYATPPLPGIPQQASPWAPVQFGPAPGLIWGDVGTRFGALVIDFLVILAGVVVMGLILGPLGYHSYPDGHSTTTPAATAATIVFMVFCIGYFPVCWWAFQRTIGQRALGLRVVKAADGNSLGVAESILRFIVFGVCMSVGLLGLIAAALASGHPMRKAWWDDASGSVVVRRA